MEHDGPQSPVRDEKKLPEVYTPLSTSQDMVVETPATPITPVTPYTPASAYNDDEEMDENDLSNTSISTEKAFQIAGKGVATPGPIKARRQLEENKLLNSPSDAMLSPCTALLMGRGGGKKQAFSGPAAALRKKQIGSIPLKLDDDE